jgi:ferredoxin-NADP reductase
MSSASTYGSNLPARIPGRMFSLQVAAIVPAAHDAVTLLLALPGTDRAPSGYLPGQFITLAFRTPQATLYRSYSLCGDGCADVPWEITVKRQRAGLVSNYLYTNAYPGMQIYAGLPQGRFTLPDTIRPDIPLVFIAGGSGITPIYGMLRALAQLAPTQRPPIWLFYTFHSARDAIYAGEIAALDPGNQWLSRRYYVTSAGQRFRAEQALAALRDRSAHAHWYVCGPGGLKRSVESAATRMGVPPSHIHAEVFASPPTDAGATVSYGPARIRLAESGAILDAEPGETLLATLLRYGYDPDFECRAGACGTCRLRLLSGQVRHGDGDALTPAERSAGYILTCVARPIGEITLAGAGQPAARVAYHMTGGIRPSVARRERRRRSLRLALAAATMSLFFGLWTFTSHLVKNPISGSNSSGTTAPSLPNLFSGEGGDDGSSSGQSQSPSTNPGTFSNQPSQNSPSTTTGVS